MSENNLPTWDETTEVQDSAQVALPSWDETQEVVEASPVSKSDSVRKGAAQGISFSFGDEAEGVLGAMAEDIGSVFGVGSKSADDELRRQGFDVQDTTSYEAIRDLARKENHEAEAANPGYYLGGNIAGGIVSPLNVIPGMNMGKAAALPMLSKEGLKAAAKTGAVQGTVAGLGNSEADLTKGDVAGAAIDTTIGTVAGGVGAPVIQAGLGATGAGIKYGAEKIGQGAKIVGGAIADSSAGQAVGNFVDGQLTNVGNTVEKVLPSVVKSYRSGKANPELNAEQFFDQTLGKYVKMGEKASKYYGEKRKGFEDAAKLQEEEILKQEALKVKLESDALHAQGEINKANKLVADFEKQIEKLSKTNKTLNEQAEKALAAEEKQLLAEAQERAKAEFQANKAAKTEAIKNTKNELSTAEANFKTAQQNTHLNASQDVQDTLVQSADQLDAALGAHKNALQGSYENISNQLVDQNVKFSSKPILREANDLIASDKSITPQAAEQLAKDLEKLIPVDDNLTLSQLKQIVQNLRGEAKAASNSGNNTLARVINNTANKVKELGYENITDPNLLKELKNVDKDYSNIFRLEEYVNATTGADKFNSASTLGQMLPNSQGIQTAPAQILKREVGNIVGSNVTPSGQEFAQKATNIMGNVAQANETKVATKFNKDMMKYDSEVQRLKSLLDNLQAEKDALKVKDVTAPELQNVGPNRQNLNEQKIIEAQNQIDGLKQQIFNETDNSVQASLAKGEKELEIAKLQQVLDNYKAENLNRPKGSPVDEILNIKSGDTEPREQKVLKHIAQSTKDEITPAQVKSNKVIDDLTKNEVISPDELSQFKNDAQVSSYIQRPVDEGSQSNRGIAMRFIPRVAYNTGRFTKAGVSIFKQTPSEVAEVVNNSNPVYGKILQDALVRGDTAYKAMLYTLQQQDPKFRQLLRDTNLINGTDEEK